MWGRGGMAGQTCRKPSLRKALSSSENIADGRRVCAVRKSLQRNPANATLTTGTSKAESHYVRVYLHFRFPDSRNFVLLISQRKEVEMRPSAVRLLNILVPIKRCAQTYL